MIDALKKGVFVKEDIVAEMSELVKREKIGRNNRNEITLFKSVGAALEDLAAAELVLTNLSETI